jgi:hypothetical protein
MSNLQWQTLPDGTQMARGDKGTYFIEEHPGEDKSFHLFFVADPEEES